MKAPLAGLRGALPGPNMPPSQPAAGAEVRGEDDGRISLTN